MTSEPKGKQGPNRAKSDARRTRLKQALRANLLKRKAQAKATKPAKDRDEGRQS